MIHEPRTRRKMQVVMMKETSRMIEAPSTVPAFKDISDSGLLIMVEDRFCARVVAVTHATTTCYAAPVILPGSHCNPDPS